MTMIDAPALAAELAEMHVSLGRLLDPDEAAFTRLGEALGTARTQLGAGSGLFKSLAELLDHGEDGSEVEQMLRQARQQIETILKESEAIANSLAVLGRSTAMVARPLAVQAKIISEIAAISINAKIHAAQINARGVDFTVFTKDIDRLRHLADECIQRAGGQITTLGHMMAEARAAVQSFERIHAAELATIAGRLDGQVTELSRRRERVRAALPQFETRTHAIAERVSRSIVALQINDTTCQRLDHARLALAMLPAVLEPERASGDLAWAADLDPEHRVALSGAVVTLQAQQIDRAAADFLAAVGEIKSNLGGLARESSAILDEAGALFDGEGGDRGFIQALAADFRRASTLIDHFCQSDQRVSGLIVEVSRVFGAIAGDLANLRSIDADLRIMGLNATLKCSRLGSAGLALGVVAQELRASSRRTEEASRQISQAIETATAEAATLAERSEREHAAAAGLSQALAGSSRTVGHISEQMDGTLGRFIAACSGVPDLLDSAVRDFTHDSVLKTALCTLTARLNALAERTGTADHDPARVREDVQRLLGGRYTMASERTIHDLFAEGAGAGGPPPPPTAATDDNDLDAFFL